MDHREKDRIQKKAAYWANPEKERKRKRVAQRKYDDLHKEERKLRAKTWRSNNIDWVRNYRGMPTPTRPEPELCECCGQLPKDNKRMCLDHCHKTGKFRSWLCSRCNLALGLLNDDPVVIRKLAKMIEDFTSRPNAGAETLEVSSGLAQRLVEG